MSGHGRFRECHSRVLLCRGVGWRLYPSRSWPLHWHGLPRRYVRGSRNRWQTIIAIDGRPEDHLAGERKSAPRVVLEPHQPFFQFSLGERGFRLYLDSQRLVDDDRYRLQRESVLPNREFVRTGRHADDGDAGRVGKCLVRTQTSGFRGDRHAADRARKHSRTLDALCRCAGGCGSCSNTKFTTRLNSRCTCVKWERCRRSSLCHYRISSGHSGPSRAGRGMRGQRTRRERGAAEARGHPPPLRRRWVPAAVRPAHRSSGTTETQAASAHFAVCVSVLPPDRCRAQRAHRREMCVISLRVTPPLSVLCAKSSPRSPPSLRAMTREFTSASLARATDLGRSVAHEFGCRV